MLLVGRRTLGAWALSCHIHKYRGAHIRGWPGPTLHSQQLLSYNSVLHTHNTRASVQFYVSHITRRLCHQTNRTDRMITVIYPVTYNGPQDATHRHIHVCTLCKQVSFGLLVHRDNACTRVYLTHRAYTLDPYVQNHLQPRNRGLMAGGHKNRCATPN